MDTGVLAALVVVAVVLACVAVIWSAVGGRRGRRGKRGPTGHSATDPPAVPTMAYYLIIADFAQSFVEIPTSNIVFPSPTIASSYLAGRAPLYSSENNAVVGTCSASFLNLQSADNVFTDISNYIATVDGLIVTWFTPTTLVNLELDNLINGMVTECIVTVTTKVGASPFFGQTFDLVVSSDGQRIKFLFKPPS